MVKNFYNDITNKKLKKWYYLTHASCIRREILYRYSDLGFDAELATKSDEDIAMTYQGHAAFLTRPGIQRVLECAVAGSQSNRDQQSRQKHARPREGVATAIDAKRGNYVCLSICDSVGKDKLTLPLILKFAAYLHQYRSTVR